MPPNLMNSLGQLGDALGGVAQPEWGRPVRTRRKERLRSASETGSFCPNGPWFYSAAETLPTKPFQAEYEGSIPFTRSSALANSSR